MPITMTRHPFGYRDVIGTPEGNNQEWESEPRITVADNAVSDALPTGLYRIYASGDCSLWFGNTATVAEAANGEPWPEGTVEVRSIVQNQKIACKAGL